MTARWVELARPFIHAIAGTVGGVGVGLIADGGRELVIALALVGGAFLFGVWSGLNAAVPGWPIKQGRRP